MLLDWIIPHQVRR